jgi:hypothetical protein
MKPSYYGTIIRSRKLKTIRSSKSNSNDYVVLRIWSQGIQYYKTLNLKLYDDTNRIDFEERIGYDMIRCGVDPIDWVSMVMPRTPKD